MGQEFSISNFKCFNQLKNGIDFTDNPSDFTTNLVGNVMEKVKLQYDVSVTWYSEGNTLDPFEVYADRIVRTSGSFLNDGWAITQKFEFYNDWVNRFTIGSEFIGEVTDISSDGRTLFFILDSGSQTTTGTQTNVGIWANASDTANLLTASKLKFGLIENQEPFNFISKVSQNQQIYYAKNIRSSVANYIKNGIYSDWITGSATIELIASGTPKNTDVFQISHELIIVPYYLLGQLTNLQNLQVPELFEGQNCVKYSLELELLPKIVESDASKQGILNILDGVTGWFNENFNGFENNYSASLTQYQKVSDLSIVGSLIISEQTRVRIQVDKNTGNFVGGQKAQVYFSYLPSSESEYQNTQTDYQTNFIYDTIQHTEGTADTIGTNVFKNVTSFIDGSGNLVIDVDLEFSTAQAQRLTTDSNYLLAVSVEDSGLSSDDSDRVNLLVDVNSFEGQVSTGLIGFDKFNFLVHNEVLGVDAGNTTITGWNEDGLVVDFDFWLDIDTKQTVLNELNFDLVASDGINLFNLDTYSFDLSNIVVVGGIQQIEIDTTRGYILANNDQFNFVKITTGSKVGDRQHYTGSFGLKVKWQRWLSNLEVDPVFYDNSKPQNNLNFKTSNYSNLNGYDIFMNAKANVSGLDSTGLGVTQEENILSGELSILDYGVADDGAFSGNIFTYDPDTLQDLGGAILGNKDTLFRIVWVNASEPDVGDVSYAIHRIQPTNSNGDDISELSSINPRLVGDLLKPKSGLTQLEVTKIGADIHTEGLIDFTKLKTGLNYDLSGRIKSLAGYFGEWIDGVCEVEQVIIPDPPPTIPAFCGQLQEADGGNGIFDKKYLVTWGSGNNSDVLYIVGRPYSIRDKFEIFVNGVIRATSGTANNNDGSNGGFDPQTGLGDMGGNLNILPFDSNNERSLSEGAIDTSGSWFIGGGSEPSRKTEFESDTGIIISSSIFKQPTDQLVWVKNLNVGDEIFVRVSGQSATFWRYELYCNQGN